MTFFTRLCLLFLLLTLSVFNALPGQNFEWVHSIGSGGVSGDYFHDVVSDSAGNVYVTGSFSGSVQFSPGVSTSGPGSSSTYLARYDTWGNLVWLRVFSAQNSFSAGKKLALGPGGSLYIAGEFFNSIILGPDTLNGNATLLSSSREGYLARFDTNGNYQWSRAIKSNQIPTENLIVNDLKTDATGNIYLAAGQRSTLILHNGTVLPPGRNKGFVAKYTPNGNVSYVLPGIRVLDMEFDNSGLLYMAGNCKDSSSIGGLFDPDSGLFIAKIDTSGTPVYFEVHKSRHGSRGVALEVDGAGNQYLYGDYDQYISIGGWTFTQRGNMFFVKLNPSDQVVWAHHLFSGGLGRNYANGMTLIGDTALFMSGSVTDTFNFLQHSIRNQTYTANDFFMALIDTACNIKWVEQAHNAGFTGIKGLAYDDLGNFYFGGDFHGHYNNGIGFRSFPNRGYFDFYFGKYGTGGNQLRVHAFLDANYNSIQDQNESDVPGLLIENRQLHVSHATDSNGNAISFCPPGAATYTMIPFNFNLIPYHLVSPDSHSHTFTGSQQISPIQEFAIHPIPNVRDLNIHLITSAHRRGRMSLFRIRYGNLGTVSMNGEVIFVKDPLFTISSLNPSPSRTNGDSLFWNFNNLMPLSGDKIDIDAVLDTSAKVGQKLQCLAYITPVAGDTTPSDNYATHLCHVVASRDPNDKRVSPSGSITPQQVANRKWLNYTIRFQNNGNDTAFVVRVTDTLHANLDWKTIQLISASHPYRMTMRNSHVAEWLFEDILLPDSATNEPGSQGYIQFRIQPKTGLQVGDSIPNNVDIYFDYNAPVRTNTVVTPIDTLVITAFGTEHPETRLKLLLYPNPSSGLLYLQGSLPETGDMVVRLYSSNGQLVSSRSWDSFAGDFVRRLDVQHLPAGVYTLEFQSGDFRGFKKVVLKH